MRYVCSVLVVITGQRCTSVGVPRLMVGAGLTAVREGHSSGNELDDQERIVKARLGHNCLHPYTSTHRTCWDSDNLHPGYRICQPLGQLSALL